MCECVCSLFTPARISFFIFLFLKKHLLELLPPILLSVRLLNTHQCHMHFNLHISVRAAFLSNFLKVTEGSSRQICQGSVTHRDLENQDLSPPSSFSGGHSEKEPVNAPGYLEPEH